jgi:ferredoxin
VGTQQLYHMLTKITNGTATERDYQNLQELCNVVRSASLCGLGMTAPNPVQSTIRHFREEYEAHIFNHRCPSGVCRKLLTFSIDQDKCTGCSLCARNCPASCIEKVDGLKKYTIDSSKCIHCSACFDVCRFDAVLKV